MKYLTVSEDVRTHTKDFESFDHNSLLKKHCRHIAVSLKKNRTPPSAIFHECNVYSTEILATNNAKQKVAVTSIGSHTLYDLRHLRLFSPLCDCFRYNTVWWALYLPNVIFKEYKTIKCGRYCARIRTQLKYQGTFRLLPTSRQFKFVEMHELGAVSRTKNCTQFVDASRSATGSYSQRYRQNDYCFRGAHILEPLVHFFRTSTCMVMDRGSLLVFQFFGTF